MSRLPASAPRVISGLFGTELRANFDKSSAKMGYFCWSLQEAHARLSHSSEQARAAGRVGEGNAHAPLAMGPGERDHWQRRRSVILPRIRHRIDTNQAVQDQRWRSRLKIQDAQ